jgi:succinate dehydrogenase/fumarate reductase flavoprotein subunit
MKVAPERGVGMHEPDVIGVGGGLAGLMAALQRRRRTRTN